MTEYELSHLNYGRQSFLVAMLNIGDSRFCKPKKTFQLIDLAHFDSHYAQEVQRHLVN